jgi:hypothetical protein
MFSQNASWLNHDISGPDSRCDDSSESLFFPFFRAQFQSVAVVLAVCPAREPTSGDAISNLAKMQ